MGVGMEVVEQPRVQPPVLLPEAGDHRPRAADVREEPEQRVDFACSSQRRVRLRSHRTTMHIIRSRVFFGI